MTAPAARLLAGARPPAPRHASRTLTATLAAGLVLACAGCGTTNVQITGAGLKESHPHDVQLTAEAPNYHVR